MQETGEETKSIFSEPLMKAREKLTLINNINSNNTSSVSVELSEDEKFYDAIEGEDGAEIYEGEVYKDPEEPLGNDEGLPIDEESTKEEFFDAKDYNPAQSATDNSESIHETENPNSISEINETIGAENKQQKGIKASSEPYILCNLIFNYLNEGLNEIPWPGKIALRKLSNTFNAMDKYAQAYKTYLQDATKENFDNVTSSMDNAAQELTKFDFNSSNWVVKQGIDSIKSGMPSGEDVIVEFWDEKEDEFGTFSPLFREVKGIEEDIVNAIPYLKEQKMKVYFINTDDQNLGIFICRKNGMPVQKADADAIKIFLLVTLGMQKCCFNESVGKYWKEVAATRR